MANNQSVEDMVERIPWFRSVDYEILHHFQQHDETEVDGGYWATPRALAKMLDKDRGYLADECRFLHTTGLLRKDNRLYSLSEMGHEFMDGGLGVDDLPEVNRDK